VPGATVSASPGERANVERVTDSEGRFFFPGLRIGEWEVTAVLSGFEPQTRKVVLEIGRTLSIDFTLRLQGFSEQVTVEVCPCFRIFSAKSPREMQFGVRLSF
jgi:hypothetical protein